MSVPHRQVSLRWQEFSGYLSTMAQRRVGPRLRGRLDATDLVQQTLLRACEGYCEFQGRGPGEVRAWLRAIMGNLINDALRRTCGRAGEARETSFGGGYGSALGPAALLADDRSTPSQKAQRHEAAAGLARALERLPEDQRLAIRLRHLDDLPLTVVAERMDRSVASVAGLLRRGLDGLRSDGRLQCNAGRSERS